MAVTRSYKDPTSFTFMVSAVLPSSYKTELSTPFLKNYIKGMTSLSKYCLPRSFKISGLGTQGMDTLDTPKGVIKELHTVRGKILITTYPPVYRTSLGATGESGGVRTSTYNSPRIFPPLLGSKKGM